MCISVGVCGSLCMCVCVYMYIRIHTQYTDKITHPHIPFPHSIIIQTQTQTPPPTDTQRQHSWGRHGPKLMPLIQSHCTPSPLPEGSNCRRSSRLGKCMPNSI